MATAVHCIKAALVLISGYLSWSQHKLKNKTMVFYWIVVALYWLLNLLSGLIH